VCGTVLYMKRVVSLSRFAVRIGRCPGLPGPGIINIRTFANRRQ
jgi:hypothetical protein